ncbi:MAG: hypothetical protein H5T69_18565 [Chloroflexi bacterium]|nr:hypothetical protein [Chloroflexota bacterium]
MTPSKTATATASATPSASPTFAPSATPSDTATPTASATRTLTPSATATATSSPTATATPTITLTPSPTRDPRLPAWTFILYYAGDSGLTFFLDRALKRMEALTDLSNVNVLVLFDGEGSNYTWRYHIQPGGQYVQGVNKWFLGEVNSGDGRVLQEFVAWAHDNYPAQYYYVAIADHGRGTQGIAWDAPYSDRLTPGELRTALRKATHGGAWRIDVLHYDACLMGMFEHAYDVRDFADYFVASENLAIALFGQDLYLEVARAEATPRQLAESICDIYFNHPFVNRNARTISAIDTSRLEPVNRALDALAQALVQNLAAHKGEIAAARHESQKFDSQDYFAITDDDEYVDLYDLALKLEARVSAPAVRSAARVLIESLESGVIVAEHHYGIPPKWGLDGAHGTALYFPNHARASELRDYVSGNLFAFTADNHWDEFLAAYYQLRAPFPEPEEAPGIPPTLPPFMELEDFLEFIAAQRHP